MPVAPRGIPKLCSGNNGKRRGLGDSDYQAGTLHNRNFAPADGRYLLPTDI